MEPVVMEAGKILHGLTYAEGLPREALKAATAQRDEMLPLFIEEIKAFLALEAAAREKPTRCSSSFICSASGGRKPLTGPWPVY
jgi:hypothetical protein